MPDENVVTEPQETLVPDGAVEESAFSGGFDEAPEEPVVETPAPDVVQPEPEGAQPAVEEDTEESLLLKIAEDGKKTIEFQQRLLTQAEALRASQQAPQQPTPAAQPVPQQPAPPAPADDLPPEIKQFMEDYPEVAQLADFLAQKKVAETRGTLQGEFRQQWIAMAQAFVGMKQKVEKMEFNADLLEKVPDAYATVQTKEFKEDWFPKQSAEIQAAFNSPEAGPVIRVMNLFRMQQAKQKVVSFDSAQKRKRDAIVAQHGDDGTRGNRRPAVNAKDDFNAGFNED